MGDVITVLAGVNPIVPIFLGKDVFQAIVAFDNSFLEQQFLASMIPIKMSF